MKESIVLTTINWKIGKDGERTLLKAKEERLPIGIFPHSMQWAERETRIVDDEVLETEYDFRVS